MNEAWQRLAPVLASIGIIIAIALLRDRSHTLAAITATMPVTVALGLWIISAAEGTDQAALVNFIRSMVVGVTGTLIWLLAVWAAARRGWRLPRLLVTGYLAWGVAIATAFTIQSLLGGPPILPR